MCVCVFVCPQSYLRNYTSDLHQIVCACYLWPWLSPPLAVLCISGFMDDVIFSHKLRLLNVAARLRQRGSHAALGWYIAISIAHSRRSGLLLAVKAY